MSHPNFPVVSHIHRLKHNWKMYHILVKCYYDLFHDHNWVVPYTARSIREKTDRWLVQCLVEFVQAYALKSSTR